MIASALIVAATGLFAFVLSIAFREARSDRDWDIEFSKTATTELRPDGLAIIRNLRDFTYTDGATLTTDWIPEAVIDPHEIVAVRFMLEPFAQIKAVGHTFLSFELADGSGYAFSIEARREKGESYSAFSGLFRVYELSYVWGTERDLVTRRLLYLRHPLRSYPLAVSREGAQRLFVSLLQKTNAIAGRPRFYNTFGANCTNMLARVVNQTKPGAVPFDLSWYLPGYSDRFLMRAGLIPVHESLEQTQADYDLTPKRAQVLAAASKPHPEFGLALRALLP